MIKKLLCVVLSGSMIFGNAGITMASETEPETVQENVNEETDSPEESFSEEDIFEDGISADDEAAELPDSTEQELEEEPEEADNIECRRTLKIFRKNRKQKKWQKVMTFLIEKKML